MAHLRKRFLTDLFKEACQFSPIVGVLGHRQVGKTTFLEQNISHYQTFDDPALILHNEKKFDLLNRNTAVLPLGCLF